MTSEQASVPSMRLFVGVAVALPVVHALAGVCETLARRARAANAAPVWVPPANYHVTLAFLGAARPEVVPAVLEAMRIVAATGKPFRFRTARIGGFPDLDRASVVWAGIEDSSGEIARLAAALADASAGLGFPRSPHAFVPHVTVARFRTPTGAKELVLPVSEQVFSESIVDSLILYKSVVNTDSSEYEKISAVNLGTPNSTAKRQSDIVHTAPFDASIGSDDGWDRMS